MARIGEAIIGHVQWHEVRVSPKTVWSFVELRDAHGCIGVGEATLGQHEAQMRTALARFESAVVGRAPAAVDLSAQRAAAQSLPEFAVISALDQAAWDLAAQHRGITVAAALGAVQRNRIPLYANINRGLASRTPDAFAAAARRAVADGFQAVKIAPFDEATLYGDDGRNPEAAQLDPGLARIAAVRDGVGPHVELMVDCHWRLNRAAAKNVLHATSAIELYWLECPVPETLEALGTLRALRHFANRHGVRLAGCEQMSLVRGFTPFLDVDAYDVMMPDVKYVGGLREMLDIADVLQARGIALSPHNPSGPVCHAASLQICAVSPSLHRLEVQYAETPLFDDLVDGALPRAVGGEISLPTAPGLGVRLDSALALALANQVGNTLC